MENNNFIKDIKFTNISSEELKSLEKMSDISAIKLEERKKSIKIKISAENLNKCNKIAQSSLNQNEKIIYEFRGLMSGLKYLTSALSYNFLTYGLGAYTLLNLGTSYIGYITNKKIIFLEVDGVNKIMKSYFFNFSDIIKFKYKNKGNDTILDFKYKNNTTDDEINKVTTGFLNWGYMFNNRIIMTITGNKSKEIINYLNKTLF